MPDKFKTVLVINNSVFTKQYTSIQVGLYELQNFLWNLFYTLLQ